MDPSGTLNPSRSQQAFTRNYKDGVGQRSGSAELRIRDSGKVRTAKVSQAAPVPRRSKTPSPTILKAIEDTAQRYGSHSGPRAAGVSVSEWHRLFRANIEIESAYNPRAVSPAGAVGLGQLMPDTAAFLGVDPTNLHQNLDGSARYLAMMLAEFKNPSLALAAYNAGPDAVRKYRGIPPFVETQNHVRRVLAVVERLRGENR